MEKEFICYHTITIQTVIVVKATSAIEAKAIGETYQGTDHKLVKEWDDRRIISVKTTVLGTN